MTVKIENIGRVEIRVGTQVLWVGNAVPELNSTMSVPYIPEPRDLVVSEGVRRVIGEYGDVLRKLSNE